MRLLLIGFWLGLTAVGLPGQTPTTAPPANTVEEADAAIAQIQAIADALATLENEARTANELARADCIRLRAASVEGLLQAARQSRQIVVTFAERAKGKIANRELQGLNAAVDRAKVHLASAKKCADIIITEGSYDTAPAPSRTAPTDRRSSVPRRGTEITSHNCLRQARLACLLMQAMELPASVTSTNRLVQSHVATANQLGCTEALAKHAITPLGGWEPDRCVTLDHFAVVVAHAIHLKPEDPADPSSYLQALREEGLPVDTLLPARGSDGPSPFVTETEVLNFLSQGPAAPLPGSRPLTPF